MSTINDFTITEKGYSDDNSEVWIKGYNPNAPVELQEEIRVIVREPMVLNLVQTDKTYLVSYSIKRNVLIILSNIKNIEDNE